MCALYNFIVFLTALMRNVLTRSGMLMLCAAIAVWRVRDANRDAGRAARTTKA